MISSTDIAIRLLASALLGSLIGFEHERLLWAAGVRTHMLVSVAVARLKEAPGVQEATVDRVREVPDGEGTTLS